MALKVWLPLNGTLENKGISDITMNGTPASWSNGKIGRCATFTGNVNQRLTSNQTNELDYTDNFSWCMWVNPNYTSGSTQYVFTVGRADATTYGYGANIPNATSLTCRFGNSTWGVDVASNEWTHVAFTKQGTSIKIYRNGELKINQTFSGTLPEFTQSLGLGLGCFYYSGGNIYPFFGSLNDFRIYDHCLSTKEVKEISQGLVLHYKLNGWSGGAGENLMLGTLMTQIPIGTSTDYTNLTHIRYYNTSASNCTISNNEATILLNGTGNLGIAFERLESEINFDTSSYYTLSCEAKTTMSGAQLSIGTSYYKTDDTPVWRGGSNKKAFNSLNSWQTFTLTFKPDTDIKAICYCFTVNGTSGGIETAIIRHCKLEKGSIATAWSPAPQDLSVDTTKIIDSSGYGNDGTVIGTLSTESDSNRYEISTKSLNGTDCIKSPLSLVDVQSFTCSFWVKPSSSNGGYSILASNYNNPSSGFWISTNCEGHALWFYNQAYADTTTANISNDVWYHCAIVCDNKTFSMYIDGVLQTLNRTTSSSKTITINNLSVFNSYTGTSWNTKRYGNISDFRFYATALSAEDILDLYHTPANVDNLQNIHAFELKEQSGNMFAGSPMTGTVTWDATNNYYTITSNPSTSTWGIGPAVGTTPKKIIPWGMSYILTYEVYSPTAAQWYIDYNNNDPTTSLSGNDNDNGRLRTGVNVPANTWTLITYGCSNTNETKNPDHLPLYDYSTGLGPVMTNISSAITWHMRNPQWYLVDADNKEHIYESGVFQANFIKEDNQSLYTSFRNEEKAAWAHGYIEK